MRSKTIVVPVTDASRELYNKCVHLNLHHNGRMQSQLVQCRRYPQTYEGTIIAILAGDYLIAWGLVWRIKAYRDTCNNFYVYTRKRYRRQGYGAKIITQAEKFGSFYIWPWEEVSDAFYAKVCPNSKPYPYFSSYKSAST